MRILGSRRLGFTKTLWLVYAAIAGHGFFDFIHQWVIENPGAPQWWPGFCLAFDVILGGWLGVRPTVKLESSSKNDP